MNIKSFYLHTIKKPRYDQQGLNKEARIEIHFSSDQWQILIACLMFMRE
jgi:hypothetical protein